jgi:tetratricopeptide (TPR) repeat protein
MGRYGDAETDFHNAIAILTPLQATGDSASVDQVRQMLARAKNNLAQLIYNANRLGDARSLYNESIELGQELVAHSPTNREYKLELAAHYNNAAIVLENDDPKLAAERNEKAIQLVKQLSEPAPYLTMQLGLFHSVRALIFDRGAGGDARAEYQVAIDTLRSVPPESQNRDFHIWLGQALAGLAGLPTTTKQAAIQLLQQAVQEQKAAGSNYDLAWDYYYLASAYREVKSPVQMQDAIAKARELLPKLPEADRLQLAKLLDEASAK